MVTFRRLRCSSPNIALLHPLFAFGECLCTGTPHNGDRWAMGMSNVTL
jgi:hypothetical protein